MAECSHDCSNCKEKCSKESLLEPQNAASNVKRVIGVVSGKGGVGKSLVTSMLAVNMQRLGYKTGITSQFLMQISPVLPFQRRSDSRAETSQEVTSVCSRL